MSFELAVKVENASVFMGGREIIHQLNWEVPRGGRYFILGANGAGKTTLVKMLMGYAWAKFGARVEVLGERFGQANLVELRKRIAWVSPCMYSMTSTEATGLDMVMSGFDGTYGMFRKAEQNEVDTAAKLMERFHCAHLMDQQMFTMSSGEQVKIMIARALLTKPDLIILDEPSVYLDISGREFLLNEIARITSSIPEVTVIFITQRIEDILPVFDHGIILAQGRIASAGKREQIISEENLSAAFGMKIKLWKNSHDRYWAMLD